MDELLSPTHRSADLRVAKSFPFAGVRVMERFKRLVLDRLVHCHRRRAE